MWELEPLLTGVCVYCSFSWCVYICEMYICHINSREPECVGDLQYVHNDLESSPGSNCFGSMLWWGSWRMGLLPHLEITAVCGQPGQIALEPLCPDWLPLPWDATEPWEWERGSFAENMGLVLHGGEQIILQVAPGLLCPLPGLHQVSYGTRSRVCGPMIYALSQCWPLLPQRFCCLLICKADIMIAPTSWKFVRIKWNSTLCSASSTMACMW